MSSWEYRDRKIGRGADLEGLGGEGNSETKLEI